MIQKNTLVLVLSAIFLSTIACQKHTSYIHPVSAESDLDVILPPAWSFGVLYGGYTNQEQTVTRVQEIIDHDYPIDAYWIDSWFWDYNNMGRGPIKFIDFVADTTSFPDRAEMWSALEENGVKGGFWVWDCIFESGNEEAFNDFKERNYFRNIYVETNSWHNKSTTTAMYETQAGHKGTVCGNIDFNNEEAVAYFKERMKHFFDEGADFIKLDRTSSIAVCKAMFEMTQEFGKESLGRGFILSHTGGTDSPEYKRYPTKWTDDTRGDWSIDKPTRKFSSWVPRVALKENIEMFTDPNKDSSTIPFLTQDLGGFDMGKDSILDEELYIRWIEFAMFCPIVELFAQAENPTANLPYRISERADNIFREYSHLRMELFPYIYSCAHQSRLEGVAMVNPTEHSIYNFTFGPSMLLSPIFEKDAVETTLTLPAGNWVNYRTSERLAGGETYKVDAPIGEIPLFIKEGAIIPMRQYARTIEQGSNDSLTIHIYDGADGNFSLIEDDGLSNDYIDGIYAKTDMTLSDKGDSVEFTMDGRLGSYQGEAKSRKIRLSLHTNKDIKTANGKELIIEDGALLTEWIEVKRSKGVKIIFE
ncbi:MAG: TIM-barrel domain-containing protein [Rikenellaceae bacterium]